jgi:hypothetical protein
MNNSIQRRLRRVLGVSLYALAVAWGLFQVFHPNSGALYLLFAAAFSFTMTYWCIVDGRVFGRPILRSFYWLIFFLWPIAVPIYLIWARRLRGLGFALLHFIGLYAVCLVAYSVAGYLTYGDAWFSPPP